MSYRGVPPSNQNAHCPPPSLYVNPQAHRSHGSTKTSNLTQLFAPKQRLATLLNITWFTSLLFGISLYTFPSLSSLFLLSENERESQVARILVRLLSSQMIANGMIIYKCRRADGEVKRVIILVYFTSFSLGTLSLLGTHLGNNGIVSLGFFGVVKVLAMVGLSLCYGYFYYFQPPAVFSFDASSLHSA